MKRETKNVPFTRAEVKSLDKGFTQTAFGPNRRTRRGSKYRHFSNSAKSPGVIKGLIAKSVNLRLNYVLSFFKPKPKEAVS